MNLQNGADTLLARLQGDLEARTGTTVHLAMTHDAIHLFGPDGRTIPA